MGLDSTEVSRQWATRPDDQRFLTMQDLYQSVKGRRDVSRQYDAALEDMQFGYDDKTVFAINPKTEEKVAFNNWSFGQAASLVKAPAGYLRTLPPILAAANLKYNVFDAFEKGTRADLRMLQTTDAGTGVSELRSVNATTYGRVWDEQVVRLCQEHIDLSKWKVPHASYASKNPLLATTLYASDRDCYIFLVNEDQPVEVPGDNGKDTLFRGVIIGNSEVGARTLFYKWFLYREVCDNRIIWGMQDVEEVRIKHSSGAPHRFKKEFAPAIAQIGDASTGQLVSAVKEARRFEVGKDLSEVHEWLAKKPGFTKGLAKEVATRAELEEGNPRCLWNLVQGATSLAKDKQHQDTRMVLEQSGSALMKYAEARV